MVRASNVTSAYIMLLSSMLTGTAAFLMVPTVLSWMGTPPDVLPDAITWMLAGTACLMRYGSWKRKTEIRKPAGNMES